MRSSARPDAPPVQLFGARTDTARSATLDFNAGVGAVDDDSTLCLVEVSRNRFDRYPFFPGDRLDSSTRTGPKDVTFHFVDVRTGDVRRSATVNMPRPVFTMRPFFVQ